jgi:Lrp/AsnC family leucine-responsive transcriptional regulator
MAEKNKVPAADEKSMQLIDETDKRMLGLLSENPNISQSELSEHLKISQPAVSLRMRKLEEKGVLTHMVGTDIKKAQLFLAKVDLSTNNVEGVLKAIETCPLYLNGFLTSGRHNMTFLLMGENVRSIMSCVDSRLRQNLPVRNIEFDLIVTPTKTLVVPLKPRIEKSPVTPCGADCSSCSFYTNERCLGCPASTHYKGKLL